MWARVQQALTTWPTLAEWQETLSVTLGFSTIAFALGSWSGLLVFERATTPVLPLLLRNLILPSLAEELVFRVLPPPRYTLLALALYVLYHPLNAWRFVPAARPLFYDPVFLTLATLLGGCCTFLYHRTHSVWPPTLLHGLVVAGWLIFLGGEAALRQEL